MCVCVCVSGCPQADLETQLRMRLELQKAHRDYQEDKARKEEATRLEEEEYRRQMMEKFAEDDRIEQMNAQKRRMKQLGWWAFSGSVHFATCFTCKCLKGFLLSPFFGLENC